ncbi:MAG: hypothetical protein AAGK05_14580, partial [Pseudomonadota bacterium]
MRGRKPKWKVPSKEHLLSVIVKGNYFDLLKTKCTPRSDVVTSLLNDMNLPTHMSQRMWVYNFLKKDELSLEQIKPMSATIGGDE